MSAIDRTRFSSVVRDAVDDAAARSAAGHAVDTRDVLVALMRADAVGEWDRIALDFGSEETVRWAPVVDPRPGPAAVWGAVPISETCADALTRARLLAEAYETGLVSVGLMVIALVAQPDSAAAMALTGGDPRRNDALLAAVQDTIVGATLVDLDRALRDQTSRDPGDAPSSPRDGAGGYEDVVAALGGERRLGDSDALALFAAALRATADEDLLNRYERIHLDADWVELTRPMVADLPTPSAAEVIERAKDRFDTDRPDARQLIVAVTLHPSERVARAMWLLGFPPNVVAFEAAAADANANEIGEGISDTTSVYTTLGALLSLATTVFIVRHVVVTHDWWPGIAIAIVLFHLTWNGHLVGNLVLTGVLWFWADAVTAVLAVAMTVVDVLLTRSETRNALHRTGIDLSMAQWRRHLRIRYPRQTRIVTAMIQRRRGRRMSTVDGAVR